MLFSFTSICFFSSEGVGPTLELLEGREFGGIISLVKNTKEKKKGPISKTLFSSIIVSMIFLRTEAIINRLGKQTYRMQTLCSKNAQRFNFS